jgi:hypothetical protein
MLSMKIRGRIDPTVGYMFGTVRSSITARIHEAIERTGDILSLYDKGLAGLTKKANAKEFRRFLLEAPGLFI